MLKRRCRVTHPGGPHASALSKTPGAGVFFLWSPLPSQGRSDRYGEVGVKRVVPAPRGRREEERAPGSFWEGKGCAAVRS
jgi:hypothetical protein